MLTMTFILVLSVEVFLVIQNMKPLFTIPGPTIFISIVFGSLSQSYGYPQPIDSGYIIITLSHYEYWVYLSLTIATP